MANSTDIVWAPWAIQAFSEAQRAAATYDPFKPPVVIPPLPPSPPLFESTGTRALVYTKERGWVPLDIAERDGLTEIAPPASVQPATGAPKPTGAAFTSASIFGGGSVLGVAVPPAPAVLLPTFVGGRVGTVRRSGGLRPESGGGPRIVKGIGPRPRWLGVVRP